MCIRDRLLFGLGARVTYVRTAKDLVGPDGPRVDALVLPLSLIHI